MVCGPGQIDINRASSGELMAGLSVSEPIAEQIVLNRPYIQARDLLVAAGLDPALVDEIVESNGACATLVELPPPSGEACVSDTAVDIQAADAVELVSRLGLSAIVADRVVAARPFATLSHLARVDGIDGADLDGLLARSCLTPAPVTTQSGSGDGAPASRAESSRLGSISLRFRPA